MKVSTAFACIILVMTFGLGSAAQPTWSHTYGGSSVNQLFGVTATRDGGYVAFGQTQAFGAGDLDGWLLCLDGGGDLLWQKTYGGRHEDRLLRVLALDDGGFMALGQYSPNKNDLIAWLLRLDPQGNVLWQHTYGDGGWFIGMHIVATPDGGYAFGGYTWPDNGSSRYWVVKVNNKGRIQWQKTYGGSDEDGIYGMASTPDGGFIITGIAGEFGPPYNDEALTLRLDSSGNVVWQKRYFYEGGDLDVNGMFALAGGNYLLFGNAYPPDASGKVWAAQINGSGDLVRQETFTEPDIYRDQIYGGFPLPDGGCVLTGPQNIINDGYEGYALCLDASLNVIWQTACGNKGADNAFSGGPAQDGGAVLAGWLATTGDQYDAWVIKMAADGTMDSSCDFNSTAYAEPGAGAAVVADTNEKTRKAHVARHTPRYSTSNSGATDMMLCTSAP